MSTLGCICAFILINIVLLILFPLKVVFTDQQQFFQCSKEFWRYLLFSLCMVSHFWSKGADIDIIQSHNKIIKYVTTPFRVFLSSGFRAFWPKSRLEFYLQIIFLTCLCALNSIDTYYRFNPFSSNNKNNKALGEYFNIIKILKTVSRLTSIVIGIYCGKIFFNRSPMYSDQQQVNIGQPYIPKKFNKSAIIAFYGLIISCLVETALLKHNKLYNTNITSLQISKKFIAGSWEDVICPLFVYPVEISVLFMIMIQFKYTINILKGVMSYYLIICGHRSVVTILSLIVVWDINRFNKDLEENCIEKFKNFKNGRESSKIRLEEFERIVIKRDNILPGLNIIIHYLICDRVLYLLFDFWNLRCDKTKHFKIGAFCSRHLFHFVLTGWIILKMAQFNRKWPQQLIHTVNHWRLRNWIMKPTKIDLGDNKSKMHERKEEEKEEEEEEDLNTFFSEEFKLWDRYLTQNNFAKRFRFRLFGYNVDIRWFTISFVMQFAFGYNVISSFSKKWNSLDDWLCL